MIVESETLPPDPLAHTRITATFTGKDEPTAASEVVAAAALSNARIIDLRQTVIQDRITLAIELQVSSCTSAEAQLYKSLLTVAKTLQLAVDFDTANDEMPMEQFQRLENIHQTDHAADDCKEARRLNGIVDRVSPTHYVVTLLSRETITPIFLTELASLLADRSFTTEKITRLNTSGLRCLELVVASTQALTPDDINQLRKQLYALGKTSNIDVALQAESVLRRSKRLVVLDMDSTLIQQEVIDELARYAGVYDKVCEITHRAMSGHLDFRQSLRERVALLKGTKASVFQKVIDNLQYTPGAKLLCKTLKKLGYRLAVISGGFTRITSHVRNELGLDYDYANVLEEKDGVFTGRTVGAVVNAQRKADLLMTIAQQEKITLDQVIAIGDGANDLPMLGTAGLGIAFNAKAAVQEAAKFRINQPSLTTVLYLLGLSEQDQEELQGHSSNHSECVDDDVA
ncbi:Phosphoserine phosphatase [Gracilariopsis chorda]|uniref:phosphoserine phosphatase n=1 Tax=Gracilariopsis chorda TaxID=448386 RepID=A0A2V3IH33_9FLOR|nr:Phosphoserine phosphatase [Gracilariopsis chorda]|eukprot:PXF41401.1 Phosphoserine phosphatase [Gracilariopsis chorda]